MKRLLLAIVIACVATSAIARNEDALVACLVGQATTSLHLQYRDKVDAKTATTIAWRYAGKRCKGRLSEGASDYVHHTIRDMAKERFTEEDTLVHAGPGVPTGFWCETEVATEATDWMFFKRGKCPLESDGVMYHKTLLLKPNGNYTLYNHAHERTCKVVKYDIKGWAKYACTDIFGNTTKHFQKFVTQDHLLGLSNTDID
jgi:hypothetical protein